MIPHPHLQSVNIKGYRPFKDLVAPLQPLEIIVGANGSGKSSLFEFLKFLRDGMYREFPSEIIEGSIGQEIFHASGSEKFEWNLEIDTGRPVSILYQGELIGPRTRSQIAWERVVSSRPFSDRYKDPFVFLNIQGNRGVVQNPDSGQLESTEIKQEDIKQDIEKRSDRLLALSTIANPAMNILCELNQYMRSWRFYSSFNIANHKIRKSVPIEQEPVLHEDAGNLSSVLHYLMTEHRSAFDELQQHLR